MATPTLEVRYGIQHSSEAVVVLLELQAELAMTEPPSLTLTAEGSEQPFSVPGETVDGRWQYRISINPAPGDAEDDELLFQGEYKIAGKPQGLAIVVRRTNCRISTALVERRTDSPLWPQTRAALLWYAWGRYRELCGLKRFTSGLSGSDVFLFRPRLPDPPGAADLPDPSWGSCLLIKTGRAESLGQEWDRFQKHLANRLHPFMARSEALLDTRPPGPREQDRDRITLVGSFLGGELLQVESFESLMRGTADAARCLPVVDKLASVLSEWHAGSGIRPLGAWDRVYRDTGGRPLLPGPSWPRLHRGPDGDWFDLPSPVAGKLRLFDKYDLESESDRKAYSGGVAWDVHFHSRDHLNHHLLGKGDRRDGLLYRLMALPVRFSLTHGDLHPRNVLVGRDDIWLLDFGETGHGPTLYDYTKLEVYLRLWCLDLRPTSGDIDDAATRFEELLLDHMTGSEGSVEPVGELADHLGARPQDLLKVASCIARIRRRAAASGTGCPDRRDYLAVLYLTVLDTLQYAGREPELAENFRLLVALGWLLEDTLSRVVGGAPHLRPRTPLDYRTLVTASWLAAPGAPARVRYVLDREDGRRALAPLAATRGVLQNQSHHLDVFDHTLLVLAYLEAFIHAADPLAALFDPGKIDREVAEALRDQGLSLLPIPGGSAPLALGGDLPDDLIWDQVRALIRRWLDDDTRLVLKWSVLFHDVGKPATRCLNTAGKKGPRVQFIGHELYGLQLVCGNDRAPGHLDLYFLDPMRRGQVADLILRHHAHHQWVNRYQNEKPGALAALEQAEHLGAVPWAEAEYLSRFWEAGANPHASGSFDLQSHCADPFADLFRPLPHAAGFLDLLFHGVADGLAGRGPDVAVPVPKFVAIDRAVLRYYAMYMLAWDKDSALFDKLYSQLPAAGLTPNPGLRGRLRPWFLHETYSRKAAGKPALTFAEFLKKAKEMNGLLESTT